jgi:hypothetical protein
VFKGRKSDFKITSLIIVYTLSKALGISPLEIYKMPTSLVKDLLNIHFVAEELQAEEMEKIKRKGESKF